MGGCTPQPSTAPSTDSPAPAGARDRRPRRSKFPSSTLRSRLPPRRRSASGGSSTSDGPSRHSPGRRSRLPSHLSAKGLRVNNDDGRATCPHHPPRRRHTNRRAPDRTRRTPRDRVPLHRDTAQGCRDGNVSGPGVRRDRRMTLLVSTAPRPTSRDGPARSALPQSAGRRRGGARTGRVPNGHGRRGASSRP